MIVQSNQLKRQNVRWFHGGLNAIDPEIYSADAVDEDERKKKKEEAVKHHPLGRPARDSLEMIDGKLCVKVPPLYWTYNLKGEPINTHMEYWPGSLCFGIVGHGFYVVPMGGCIDLPGVSEKAIRDGIPHLLSHAEAVARGLADDVGNPVKALSADTQIKKASK